MPLYKVIIEPVQHHIEVMLTRRVIISKVIRMILNPIFFQMKKGRFHWYHQRKISLIINLIVCTNIIHSPVAKRLVILPNSIYLHYNCSIVQSNIIPHLLWTQHKYNLEKLKCEFTTLTCNLTCKFPRNLHYCGYVWIIYRRTILWDLTLEFANNVNLCLYLNSHR